MSISLSSHLSLLPILFLVVVSSFLISFTTASPVYFDISTCTTTSCVHVAPFGSDITGNGTLIAPVQTIQRALDVAMLRRTMGNPGAIKIVLDDGTYPGGIVWKGNRISLTSRSGSSVTFIDCNMTTFGIRIDSDQNDKTVISGITIQHCKATLGGGVAVIGDETHPILRDMVIQNNTALSGAGLLVNLAYPTVINVTFQDNVARQGGGIGIVANAQPVTIRDCSITRNSAPGSFAGGVFLSLANVQIYNTTLSYNSAIMGGAFHMDSSILQMYGSSVFSNVATFDDGGGLYGIRSILEVYDSIWRGNSGYAKGGCLKIFLAYNQNRDYNKFPYDFRAVRSVFDQNIGVEEGVINLKDFISASLEDCIISNSQCNNGNLFAGASSQLILNNVLFYKGQSNMGAGMYIKGAKVTCTNCTFTQNVATIDGGAVRVDSKSSLKLIDPIFTSNTAKATGGALACISGSCQVIGGIFDSNMANEDGGAIAVTSTTLTVSGTLFKNNNATNGGAIRTGIAATSTITGSTFQANRAASGTLYWTTPSTATADAMLIQNTFVSGSTSYGNEFASAPAALTFFSPDDVILPAAQRSDLSFINNHTIIMAQTIANVASFPIRLAILDIYGQRVNTASMASIDVFASITPYISNLDNSSININSAASTQSAIFVNWDRIHMPAGIASFQLAIAGELGASYAIDFTTSLAGVAGVRIIVTIQECQELDYTTYYPPGSTTYRVCRAATPKYISSAMFTGIVVACVICIMLAATVQLSTIVFWNTPVFRGSTPSFMSLMLLGAQIGYVAIILANIDVDRTSQGMSLFSYLCRAQYWLLGLSFVFMFGTLALKTWRIRKIFCNASLTDLGTHVATRYLYTKLGILLAIEMIINIGFNAADPLQGIYKVTDTTYSAVCHSKSSLVYMCVMLISKGMIAVVCVLLAYDTRNVISAFNESKQLMIASYNMFVSIIVVVVLSIILPDPSASKAVVSFGTLFVITSTWIIIYAPKLYICIAVSERNISGTLPAPASTNKNSQGSQESQRVQQQRKGKSAPAPVSAPAPDQHMHQHATATTSTSTPRENITTPSTHYRSASAGPTTYALLSSTATATTTATATASAAVTVPKGQRRRQASVASVSPSDLTCALNARPRAGTGHKVDSSVSQFPSPSQIQNGFINSPSAANINHHESSATTGATSTPLNGNSTRRHSISDIELVLVQSGTATNTIGYNYN